jgi:competence protein ComEA
MQRFMKMLVPALAAQFLLVSAVLATVNINTASKDELIALPGIGPAKAQAIIDHRKTSGPFKSVDDLKGVKGIGAKRLEKLRGEISVAPAPAATKVSAAKQADGKAAGVISTKDGVSAAGDAKTRR